MNNRLSFVRPAVFVSCCIIMLSTAILCFTEHYRKFLVLAVLAAGILFVALFVTKSRAAAFFLGAAIILGAVLPYRAYITREAYADRVLEILGDSEYTFSGNITYSSASTRPVNVRVNVTQINERKVKKPFSMQATSFSGEALKVGDNVTFKGTPTSIEHSDEGEFDNKTYLRSKNTFIKVYGAEFVSSSTNENATILSSLRTHYEKAVYKYVRDDYSYTSQAIIKALTLGDKTDFTKSMSQIFSKSGLSHLMCVSGLHLTVILGMFAAFLKIFSLRKNIRCILLCGICVFYILFTGASPSVIRAGIMACFTYIALLIGRKNDSVVALFISGAAMTMADAYVVLDVSARLSFVSTLGVILMGNATDSLFPKFKINHPVVFGIISAVFINIGAVCITLPLSADTFGGFSTVSIPATLLTGLACEILIILSNILCLFSFIPHMDFLCVALGNLCNNLAQYIINIAEYFSSLKHSYLQADNFHVIFLSSMIFLALLSLFLSFGAAKASRITLLSIVILSLGMGVLGIRQAIIKDKELYVSYYRKNKDDRQLCVKLGTNGHIIFNADDMLCANPEKADFDALSGNNHIVLLPDNNNPYILSQSILNFSSRYGIKGVLVPDTNEGHILAENLSSYGISCYLFPDSFEIENFKLEFSCDSSGTCTLAVSDENEEIYAVFANKYKKEYFDGHSDICAYFTRETKTQFKPQADTPPECRLFITRADKEYSADGVLNTFGKTSFEIKEG